MSYGGGAYPGSNAIEIIPDTSADPWPPTNTEQAIWATDDDYSAWSAADPAPAGSSEPPPNKKPRGGDAKAIGKMFFKTKLCCKFRAGTCPYITNCNFAHGMEELRRPPPNWQEIVAAAASHEDGPREEHQIPILSSETLMGDPDQRSYKGRHCKKFYTGEGCPYGDSCTYLHDEQSKARESVAISLTSSIGPVVGGYGGGAAGQNQKPSNWKTRICNKWELTGYCPFGSKCHFAHGVADLQREDNLHTDPRNNPPNPNCRVNPNILPRHHYPPASFPPSPSSGAGVFIEGKLGIGRQYMVLEARYLSANPPRYRRPFR